MSGGKFDNKTVLVTGGGGGIGQAVATAFAREGAFVVLLGRQESRLSECAERIRAVGGASLYMTGDVSSTTDVGAVVERIRSERGSLDVLVNAAGVMRVGLVHESSEDDFDQVFSVNVRGLWLVSKYAVPLLRGRPNANIIHLSSIAGTRTDTALGLYEASKAAVNTLTKVMAKELGPDRIRVNAIAPGPIDTELYHGSVFGDDLEDSWAGQYKVASIERGVPFGRMGSPDEVARLALFFASPESDFISGSITSIDGAVGY